MTASSERRRNGMRLPCNIRPTRARRQGGAAEEHVALTILNLGIDGALVAAAEPLQTGDRLALAFRLPDDPVELGGLLDVRWAEHVHERGEDVWLAGGAFVPPSPIAGALG